MFLWVSSAFRKDDILFLVAFLPTPFSEGTAFSAHISVILSLTKCKLISLARTLTPPFCFNFHLKKSIFNDLILDPFIKTNKQTKKTPVVLLGPRKIPR